MRCIERVPKQNTNSLSMDQDVPLMRGGPDAPDRFLLAPMPLARMIQAAGIEPGDLVLDVGCTTGYSTALLSRLADSVVGLECDAGLAETVSKALMELEADNAVVVTGPSLPDGYAEEAPYDVILINGQVAEVPDRLLSQLKDRGRLAAIVSEGGVGKACLFIKFGGRVDRRVLFDAGAPALPGFERMAEFVF